MVDIKDFIKRYYSFSIEKTKELRNNRNALMFLLFLFLSTCFWVINALSKDDYVASLSYPVKLVNNKTNELIRGEQERQITMKVRGGGFSILRHQIKSRGVYTIDISQKQRINVNEKYGALVSTNDYIRDITRILANDMELIEIIPDTLFVPIIEKVNKKVPVKLNASLQFDKQMQLSGGISISPDSIEVSGPQDVIDTLQYVATKEMTFEKLKDTLTRNIALRELKQVEMSDGRVVVSIPVEPFTEVSLNVPIVAKNLSDSLLLKSFPSEVKVSYRIGLSREVYEERDFSAVVDFADLTNRKMPSRLKVKLDKQPSGVSYVKYSPVFIEYLLEKKGD